MSKPPQTKSASHLNCEEQEVLDLIERETTAFFCRDYATWAECWLHDAKVRRLGALMGGLMEYSEGWERMSASTVEFMKRYPTPNPEAAKAMCRANISVHITAEMAWVSFDQYGEPTTDTLVTIGLSHQVRILEKHSNLWKIVMAGHGDTSLAYMDFPVIRIDEKARIEWMNDAARNELPTHPALTKSGAYLRGRYPSDEKLMRQTIADVTDLTVMDRRPSLANPRGRLADPVVLKGDSADGQHIVWVSIQDGGILVTFRDQRNEALRIDQASEMFGLSPAQTQLAGLVLQGLDLGQIASKLNVSRSTAKTHLTRVFDKTGARSQAALVSTLLSVTPPG